MIRLGIDLGGTKIEIIALDERGNEILRERTPTPQMDYPATLDSIKNLILETESTLGTQGSIGIGMPGALSVATGLVKNSNSVALNGKPLKQDLEKNLGREIRITNDANCFALSEASDGAGKDDNVVFGVIVGTGTGGGIVINKKVLIGPNAIAGEWGHNPLPWPQQNELPGPDCYCGKKGCIETFLSGPGMANDHLRVTGNRLSAPEIIEALKQGDQDCEATLQRYEDRMARATAHVINILDPDVIVLGGGMSNIQRLYENVPQLWKKYVFSDRVDTKLRQPVYGDSSGVRGAAWLWD
ncbi:MAG: ROK family protein [Gammaproteobacteria bacterium]|nr:ROK family protein [Gammaproteobacteria bacterium]